ncbi:MAG: FlgO family outer membrane protein [Desulfurivibrionaceae bacterium]
MRYRISFLLSTIFIALALQIPAAAFETGGRSTVPEYMPSLELNKIKSSHNGSGELTGNIEKLASTLSRNMEYPDPFAGDIADGLLATTFVKLDNLYSTSSFGRYLAEQLMTEFRQLGYNVIDVRKSRSLMLKKQTGEFGISRDSSELKEEISADGMLSGTYVAGPEEILVNARILDNKTGRLLAGAVERIPRTPLIDKMLKRTSSAEQGKGGVMYMKELGGRP